MFSKWFKPRWQQRDARSRLAAVKELNPVSEDDLAALVQLSRDDDSAVRTAAIQRLPLTSLLTLATATSNDEAQSSVLNRLHDCIAHGQLPLAELNATAQRYPILQLTQRFVEHHPVQQDVLRYLDDELKARSITLEQALKMLRRSRHHAITISLIENITDSEQLQNLTKHVEHFDKRANQLLRDRLRHFREQQKEQEQRRAALDKLLQRIEQFAKMSWHPLYEAETQHVAAQWQAVDNTSPADQLRFQNALTSCLQKIAQQKSVSADVAVTETSTAQITSPETTTEVDVIATPVEIKAVRNKEKEQQNQYIEQQFDANANHVQQALDAREPKNATTLLQALRQFVRDQKMKLAPRHHSKLQALQSQLDELAQWQQFAVLPKLEQLCVAMESLIESALSPKDKAINIRELQEQWKQLRLPNSPEAQAFWSRFKAAADIAYAPCADYFEHEKDLRQRNLAQRITICESLELFASEQHWEQANWVAVEKVIHTAIKEFTRFYPVERAEEKSIKARFDQALSVIKDRLHEHFRSIENQKKALIETATTWLDDENKIEAAKKMQALQQQWKHIGQGKHGSDQALWKQFQTLGNQIFANRQAYFDAKDQAMKARHDKASEVIDTLSTLLTADDQDISSTRQQFVQLKTTFLQLELNDKSSHALIQRYDRVCSDVKHHIDAYAVRQKEREWNEWSALAKICQAIELAHDAASIGLHEQRWQAHPESKIKQIMNARFTQAVAQKQQNNHDDAATIELQHRQLCVELEIAAGLDSPPRDADLRKSQQYQLLSQKFTHNKHSSSDPKQKIVAWWQMPSADIEKQSAFECRVMQVFITLN